MIEGNQGAFVNSANDLAAFSAREGEDFIDHDLRWQFQAVRFAWFDGQPEQRRGRERAGHEAHQHAVHGLQPIRLNDNGRTGFPVVSAAETITISPRFTLQAIQKRLQ